MRTIADSQADQDRFIKRVIESENVWILSGKAGVAVCQSHDYSTSDGEPLLVLLFFSDRAYAKRVQQQSFPRYQPEEISLFDFLYRWLPGMTQDHRLAGVNWSANLVGREIDPFELREKITSQMDEEKSSSYHARYLHLTSQTA